MTTRLIILATLTLFTASGCSFVDTTETGEKSRVLSLDEVKTCRKLGHTKVSVLDKIVGIPRPSESVAEELSTAGRNSAGDMGGDTIVAEGPVVDGAQTFLVYKCVDPNAE